MTTLLIRLEGPMQSWGLQSRFGRRDTGLEPSKSGVVGLLCAALGRPRDADLSDLASLRMGVRVDRPGALQSDYHTVGGASSKRKTPYGVPPYGVATFDGSDPRPAVTLRFYLADASFLVGLEAATPAQETLLTQLASALAHPIWPLFLGRKAFVPALPVHLPDGHSGLRPLPLEQALRDYPWPEPRDGEPATKVPDRLRLVIEEPSTPSTMSSVSRVSGESRMDVPVSFQPLDRRYQRRFVQTTFLDRPMDRPPSAPAPNAADPDSLDSSDREEE